jgi:hypothetical protein
MTANVPARPEMELSAPGMKGRGVREDNWVY